MDATTTSEPAGTPAPAEVVTVDGERLTRATVRALAAARPGDLFTAVRLPTGELHLVAVRAGLVLRPAEELPARREEKVEALPAPNLMLPSHVAAELRARRGG